MRVRVRVRVSRLKRATEREAEHVEVGAGAVQAIVDDDVKRLAAKRAVERLDTRIHQLVHMRRAQSRLIE